MSEQLSDDTDMASFGCTMQRSAGKSTRCTDSDSRSARKQKLHDSVMSISGCKVPRCVRWEVFKSSNFTENSRINSDRTTASWGQN